MILRNQRREQSLAYVLMQLSQRHVTRATQLYLAEQRPARLKTLVRHALFRMGAAARWQFGLVLGVRRPGHVGEFFDEDAPTPKQLMYAYEAEGAEQQHLFAKFLNQNPRALETLDIDALQSIVASAAQLGAASEVRANLAVRRRQLTAIRAATLLFGIGLVAIVAGDVSIHSRAKSHHHALSSAPFVMPVVPPFMRSVATSQAHAAIADVSIKALAKAEVKVSAPHTKRVVHVRPAEAPPKVAPTQAPVRIAQVPVWREVPTQKPQRPAASTDVPVTMNAPRLSTVEDLARSEVVSYLTDVQRGDQQSALARLGLSPQARATNLSEAPILADGSFRIVDVIRAEGGAKVDVEFKAGDRQFFGLYTLASRGGVVRITSHTLIPVSGPGLITQP